MGHVWHKSHLQVYSGEDNNKPTNETVQKIVKVARDAKWTVHTTVTFVSLAAVEPGGKLEAFRH